MKNLLLIRLGGLVIAALCAVPSFAQQNLPGGGWTYDPARDGMQDLRALKPIEGCLEPGGLVRVTSTDEPGVSSPYWCGLPPFCLTEAATPIGEQCTILPFSRRDPRYDPNGSPGANGVRDPLDLRCVNTGLMPINGRCPLPPEVSAAINPGTVQVNANTVLTINSPHATSMSMSCTGANSAFHPYNQSSLNAYAGRSHTFGGSRAMLTGVTTCTIRATNVRGSRDVTVSFNAIAPTPAPTVQAVFNPTDPTVNSSVQVRTLTTNATSLTWSCSGRWGNQNTARAVGGWITSNHSVSGSPGSANCTFTAIGPGGTATTTASWTSSNDLPSTPSPSPSGSSLLFVGNSGVWFIYKQPSMGGWQTLDTYAYRLLNHVNSPYHGIDRANVNGSHLTSSQASGCGHATDPAHVRTAAGGNQAYVNQLGGNAQHFQCALRFTARVRVNGTYMNITF